MLPPIKRVAVLGAGGLGASGDKDKTFMLQIIRVIEQQREEAAA